MVWGIGRRGGGTLGFRISNVRFRIYLSEPKFVEFEDLQNSVNLLIPVQTCRVKDGSGYRHFDRLSVTGRAQCLQAYDPLASGLTPLLPAGERPYSVGSEQ